MSKAKENSTSTTATVVYHAELRHMAHGPRNNTNAAEYRHVVLALLFLKYISDVLEQHARLRAERGQGADPKDPDEYRPEHILGAPRGALAAPESKGGAAHQWEARGGRHG